MYTNTMNTAFRCYILLFRRGFDALSRSRKTYEPLGFETPKYLRALLCLDEGCIRMENGRRPNEFFMVHPLS